MQVGILPCVRRRVLLGGCTYELKNLDGESGLEAGCTQRDLLSSQPEVVERYSLDQEEGKAGQRQEHEQGQAHEEGHGQGQTEDQHSGYKFKLTPQLRVPGAKSYHGLGEYRVREARAGKMTEA